MKKIVALVLAMVMVMGLATTAFGAITLWAPNGSTEMCDIYDGEYNTKVIDNVAVTFHPAKALKVTKGVATNVANVAYYTIDLGTATDLGYWVLADKIPADADASEYILVKAHDAKAELGYEFVGAQTSKDAFYILKNVDYVHYTMTGVAFTAWTDACEGYADPELEYANGKAVPFYTLDNKTDAITDLTVKYAKDAASAGVDYQVLVAGEVVAVDADVFVKATAHTWRASKFDAQGVATAYTCTNCKTVGTVINASINAPAGAKIDNVGGVLIAYTYSLSAPAAGETVESAKTFDAGIAMYVGMSVMAAAGSAVVLKKKD